MMQLPALDVDAARCKCILLILPLLLHLLPLPLDGAPNGSLSLMFSSAMRRTKEFIIAAAAAAVLGRWRGAGARWWGRAWVVQQTELIPVTFWSVEKLVANHQRRTRRRNLLKRMPSALVVLQNDTVLGSTEPTFFRSSCDFVSHRIHTFLGTLWLRFKRVAPCLAGPHLSARAAVQQRNNPHINMSGKAGKGSSARAGKKTASQSRSKKAGLQFPVGRIHRFLKKGRYAGRIGAGSPVYLAAVIEYLTAEVLELAGNAARDNKKSRIIPRHIQLAVRNDEELNKLLHGTTIAQGGVLPNIHGVLLPKKSKGGKEDSQ